MTTSDFENEFVSFTITDGVLFGKYKVAKLDLQAAQASTKFRKEILKGKSLPAIADISKEKDIPKEAREFFASQGGDELAALAVIISNPVTKMMGNFFVKFHPPKYPFRLFNDVESAKVWIQPYTKYQNYAD